jgi:hypothetical protein
MVKRTVGQILGATIVAVGLGLGLRASASAQGAKPENAPSAVQAEGVSSATQVTLHGKIVDVDKAKKLITLEGPQSRRVALRVDNPANLAAAKVGEPVVARFYEVASIRKKRAGENVAAVSLKEGISGTTPGGAPGGTATGLARIVVTVVAIDQANGTITVKGPDEAVETVKARDPKNLTKVKVGDELVVTLWRAIVLSLEKDSGN